MDGAREHPSSATRTMERVCEKLDYLSNRMSAIEAQLQLNVSAGSHN